MTPTDYSFKAQLKHAVANFEANFFEEFGFTIEEARKDPELVKRIDEQLNRTMWDMGSMPSPFNAE